MYNVFSLTGSTVSYSFLNQLIEGTKCLYAADARIISPEHEYMWKPSQKKKKREAKIIHIFDALFLTKPTLISFGPWTRASLSMHSNLRIVTPSVLHGSIPVSLSGCLSVSHPIPLPLTQASLTSSLSANITWNRWESRAVSGLHTIAHTGSSLRLGLSYRRLLINLVL